MDILIEYHGLWRLPAALKIADELREHEIYWHEEPIWMQNFDDLARYRERVRGRVAGSENLGTVPWYREVFVRGALDVAHFDIGWIGGVSEGQRIAHLAAAFDRFIAPHDCTGPVTLIANVHMLAAAPNAARRGDRRAATRAASTARSSTGCRDRVGVHPSAGRPGPGRGPVAGPARAKRMRACD
jgi:L-alanine-DL-glutamate epimerase-like enolase superfamily enzyme